MPVGFEPVIYTKEELVGVVSGTWLQNEPDQFVVRGIFVSAPLFKFGHVFIAAGAYSVKKRPDVVVDMLKKGAALAIVDKYTAKIPKWASVILVDDADVANEQLAIYARERTESKVIAITGSVGKTSVKDALYTTLQSQKPTFGSYLSINGGAGLKNQLSNLPKNVNYAVFELGMLGPNSITSRSELTQPDVAVITSIAPAHMAYHEDINSIINTKCDIVRGLREGGHALIPRDSQYFSEIFASVKSKSDTTNIVTFGEHEDSDIRMISFEQFDGYSEVVTKVIDENIRYRVGLSSRFWALNTLAILGAVRLIGANVREAAPMMALLQPSMRRGERFRVELLNQTGVIEIIDDTFNANPSSMRSAIEHLNTIKTPKQGRKLLVLGDMEELGEGSETFHKDLLEPISKSDVDLVCTVGEKMKSLYRVLPERLAGLQTDTSLEMAQELQRIAKSGDVWLVKGSNKTAMNLIVKSFVRDYGDALNAPLHWTLEKELDHDVDVSANLKGSSKTQEFDNVLLDFLRLHDIPGASVTVGKSTDIIYTQTYGLDVATDKPLEVGSALPLGQMSTLFTATGILKLIDDYDLSLDDRVFGEGGLLEGLRAMEDCAPNKDLDQITLRHLLCHGAGWNPFKAINPYTNKPAFDPMLHVATITEKVSERGTSSGDDIGDLIRFMMDQPLQYAPGTSHAYSDFGYVVLGKVIEVIAKTDLKRYLRDMVDAQFGITQLEFLSERPGIEGKYSLRDAKMLSKSDASMGICANSEDLTRLAMQIRQKLPDYLHDQLALRSKVKTQQKWHFGLGWRVTPTRDGGINLWSRSAHHRLRLKGQIVRPTDEGKFTWSLVLSDASCDVVQMEAMMNSALKTITI